MVAPGDGVTMAVGAAVTAPPVVLAGAAVGEAVGAAVTAAVVVLHLLLLVGVVGGAGVGAAVAPFGPFALHWSASGRVTVQMHSFPAPFPVHEGMASGRGSQLIAASYGTAAAGTVAESPHPRPSLKRNVRASPGEPVWHCLPPSFTREPLTTSVASVNPSAGVHVESSF
eukprot:3881170-Amphidinium_carterae.1